MSTDSLPLRLAVVGVNNQGRDHIKAIAATPGVELVALVDKNESLVRQIMQDNAWGTRVRVITDLDRAFAAPDIHAFIVALPHHLHLETVQLAAEHGKHLLKEKPLARSLREGHAMVAAAHKAGIVLHTGVQRRHHRTYCELRDQLHGQEILSVDLEMRVVAQRNRGDEPPATWRDDHDLAGGGVLIDLGYHGIDLLHFLLGPMEVLSCSTWTDGRPTRTDRVEANARVFARAGTAHVHMVFGRGTQKVERLRVGTRQGLYEADRERVTFQPCEGPTECLVESPRAWDSTSVEQLASLIRAIRGERSQADPLSEQTPTLRFIDQCYASRRAEGLSGRER